MGDKRNLTIDDLLDAPRGQRMCLAFAEIVCTTLAERSAEEGWRSAALFYASYVLDPGAGVSRVMMYAEGSECAAAPITAGMKREALATAVRALTDLPLVPATPELLLEALAVTVEEARYWQEPNGEYALAAAPEMHGPLARITEHLLASPHTAWWGDMMADAPQWVAVPQYGGDDARLEAGPRDTAARLERWRAQQAELEARAQCDRGADPTSGWSGEWWSIPPHGLLESTRVLDEFGPVSLHLREDSNGPEHALVARVGWPASARVFEVRGPDDWAALCRIGAVSVTCEKRHDWFRATGEDRHWVVPNWRLIAERYDAVHLSVQGYLTGAGRAINCGPAAEPRETASVIAGWNPDVTYWLNDVARPAVGLERWERIEPDTHINVHAWRLVGEN